MAILTAVIDSRIPTPSGEESRTSLLALPLGTSSFVEWVASQVAHVPDRLGHTLYVVPRFTVEDDYARQLQTLVSSPIEVVSPQGLLAVLDTCELTDRLLLIDVARWPGRAMDLSGRLADYATEGTAVHFVGAGVEGGRARERVERDGAGQIKRIQRIFGGTAQPDVVSDGIFVSLVPARAVGEAMATSLVQLRAGLAVKGVLSRDVPLPVDIVDLTQWEGVLSVTERVLSDGLHKGKQNGFVRRQDGVLVGRNCAIDSEARFIGQVIVHHGTKVGRGATIVGPAVLGRGSDIQEEAVVAQSVLAPETTVKARVTLRHCVASGTLLVSTGDSAAASAEVRPGRGIIMSYCPRVSSDALPGCPTRDDRRLHFAVKRVADVVLSAVGLVLLAPLLAMVAIAIKQCSPGPIFFIHRREQKGGEEFPCLKFRTMVAGAHQRQRELYALNQMDGPQFKLHNDPRIHRVGKWLRRTNIDELPQLVNVLLGHMSLVGPRPSPFRENQVCVPWRRARLSVRPGITGLWQVCRSPDRTAGDFHEWIFYDIAYVRHFSIWLDIKILLATLLTGGRRSIPISRLIPGAVDNAGH